MEVLQIPKIEWDTLAKDAHVAVFGGGVPHGVIRYDYALVAVQDEIMQTYVTVREVTKDIVYWQYGGAFPPARDTIKSYRGYEAMTEWTRERYSEIFTLIENTNTVMLKFALHIGYRIIGVRNFDGEVLLEHRLDLKEG